jgi:NCAIR mutase (PurE)-related protein
MSPGHEAESAATADLGFARLDLDRARRQGAPEVVFGPGKSAEQITAIVGELLQREGRPVMVTRVEPDAVVPALEAHEGGEYVVGARLAVWGRAEIAADVAHVPRITVVSAGTADAAVASEAAEVARALGAVVDRIDDVGVAGVHRVLEVSDRLTAADVVVVVAGMEGALASVVGGLVEGPVVAVPTSVGYGAAFDGMAALLGMLTSCAAGVVVVNIDSGFGAAMAAFRLARAARRLAAR